MAHPLLFSLTGPVMVTAAIPLGPVIPTGAIIKENAMKRKDIIRAWKSPEFRRSLSQEQQAQLPGSPAGLIELNQDDLMSVSGGSSHTSCCTCSASICTPCPPEYCL
ncbi:MAG: mersacidin/lichenicidin family type 2 lantibiotic [Acidobacteriota bacterium]